MAQVRHISDDEIASVMSVQDVVDSCHEAFRLYGLGQMHNPTRMETLTRENDVDLFRLEMPAAWPGHFCGRKVIEERSNVKTGRLGARTAVFELEDMQSGVCAVLDAEWMTNMRTGAAGALGIHYFAQKPIGRVAILGTGRIAQALALCCDVLFHPEVICVTSRSADRRQAFVREVGPLVTARLQASEDLNSCVTGAEAILTAVPTPSPILFAHQVPQTVPLSVMGGDQRTQQLDLGLFLSRTVVPDHVAQVQKSGDFVAAQKAQAAICWALDEKKSIQTVGNAALGQLERLRGQGGIVYFSGMAIQDLHLAATIWQRFNT